MKLSEIRTFLECQSVSPGALDPDSAIDIQCAYASDLMSDILVKVKPGSLLLTGLTNNQVVRTGKVAAVGAIIFVRGKKPNADTVKLAEQYNIPLLTTDISMFDACGMLFAQGIKGVSSLNCTLNKT
jgi:hypothetical protein